MLTKIPILTCLIFAVVYPLCFWISHKDPLKNNFHKFHLGLADFLGAIAVMSLLPMEISSISKAALGAWIIILFAVSAYSWNKDYPSPALVTIPSVIGLWAFALAQCQLIGPPSLSLIFVGILAGFILCSSAFTMNLGHWYLNVHGLNMNHLLRATYVFWFFVVLRALWDIYQLFTAKILYQGDWITILQFMSHMDGFLLVTAFFFGTLFPLVSLYFVKGTLEVKSTQSATGILYVILSAVLIGDITYKYYLIKFGLIL